MFNMWGGNTYRVGCYDIMWKHRIYSSMKYAVEDKSGSRPVPNSTVAAESKPFFLVRKEYVYLSI